MNNLYSDSSVVITNQDRAYLHKEEIMAALLLVFANGNERASCCADLCHDWENQPNIFGSETEKMLNTCNELMKVSLRYTYYPDLSYEEIKKRKQILLKKIYGIAKAHGLFVHWYGETPPLEPDRFLISGRGHERLAFIQC